MRLPMLSVQNLMDVCQRWAVLASEFGDAQAVWVTLTDQPVALCLRIKAVVFTCCRGKYVIEPIEDPLRALFKAVYSVTT